jgi:thiamine-monophosphate kinase
MEQEERMAGEAAEGTLGAAGERAAVARVLGRLRADRSVPTPWVIEPGDDAAALALPAGEVAVLTTDTLVEGVHFERSWTSPEDLGYKLIQSATSDVGAVAARPRAALVAVSAPGMLAETELLALTEGMLEAARAHGLVLAGGDTTQAPILVLTASVLGSAEPAALRSRSGARPGDFLAVTGELGDAAAGLLALKELERGQPPPPTWLRAESALAGIEKRLDALGFAGDAPALAVAARRFLRPSPPISIGPKASAAGATALIDISDGLGSELGLIAEASGVGIMVETAAVPVGAGARAWAGRHGGDPLSFALNGGEDYELLIAVPPDRWESLVTGLAAERVRVIKIGEAGPHKQGVQLRDAAGKVHPLQGRGYEHFRRR